MLSCHKIMQLISEELDYNLPWSQRMKVRDQPFDSKSASK